MYVVNGTMYYYNNNEKAKKKIMPVVYNIQERVGTKKNIYVIGSKSTTGIGWTSYYKR